MDHIRLRNISPITSAKYKDMREQMQHVHDVYSNPAIVFELRESFCNLAISSDLELSVLIYF
jgi:hypothetical protein